MRASFNRFLKTRRYKSHVEEGHCKSIRVSKFSVEYVENVVKAVEQQPHMVKLVTKIEMQVVGSKPVS
jgi:diketogulonate reductase-like aldo/keto reductase